MDNSEAPKKRLKNVIDYSSYVGARYGHVTIIGLLPREFDAAGHIKPARCKAVCDCGKEFEPRINSLRRGDIRSCGCAKKNPHKYRAQKAKRAKPESTECRERSYIAEVLKVKWECLYPQEKCLRSMVSRICCCECDKRERCGWACKNEPQKCGARKITVSSGIGS